jgi:hypothetical protein
MNIGLFFVCDIIMYMNKKTFIILIAIVFIASCLLVVGLFTPEDTWLCENGQWVKHGNPSAGMPSALCGGKQFFSGDRIKVQSPALNDLVESPFIIKGEAVGNWFFEASFPIQLLDANDNDLTVGIAQAQGDWMTENFVPFEAKLEFSKPATDTGKLILHRDNPSGLAQFDEQIIIPIRF